MTLQPAARSGLLVTLWHGLAAAGLVVLVGALWLLVAHGRAVALVLGAWLAYRAVRLTVFAFRHDARRFTS